MSSVRALVAAIVLSTTFTGVAYARDPVFTAKLEAPVSQSTRVIAQNAIWNCNGDTCFARPNHAASVRSCRQLVRELGARIVAYGPAGDELSADEISRCNSEDGSLQARN